MNKKLTLDPSVRKQLKSLPLRDEKEIQEFLQTHGPLTTFLDFRVDWAFRFIMGHKELLLMFLNDLLPFHVASLEYLPNEVPVISAKEKRSVFDVICKDGLGKKFVVEMQRREELDMDARLIYYGSTLLHNQVKRKDKDYMLNPVYVVCIADYVREHTTLVEDGKFEFHYRLIEVSNHDDYFSDTMHYYFVELPRLQKVWDSATTKMERWCYLFRNLSNFTTIPKDAGHFKPIFDVAVTGELDSETLNEYLSAMVTDYDKHVIGEYNFQKGLEKGMNIGAEKWMKEGVEKGKSELLEKARALVEEGKLSAEDLVNELEKLK